MVARWPATLDVDDARGRSPSLSRHVRVFLPVFSPTFPDNLSERPPNGHLSPSFKTLSGDARSRASLRPGFALHPSTETQVRIPLISSTSSTPCKDCQHCLAARKP